MLERDAIISLKKVNISKDAEKTKERVRAAWAKLPRDRRDQILSLSNLNKVTVERAYKTGAISARLVVSFAQVLELNPYYLTGQADEQEPYSEALVIQFLAEHGYNNLQRFMVKPAKRPYKRRTETVDTTPAAPEPVAPRYSFEDINGGFTALLNAMTENATDDLKQHIEDLTEEDMALLLKGQLIKAKFAAGKANLLTLVKYILVQ